MPRAYSADLRERVVAALADALDRVTPADARGFFRGCGYALPAN